MKVVFTGGHPSPAFACIEYIREVHPEWELLFVGREVSQPGSGQQAWERQTAAEYGVPFVGIDTGKSSASGREVFSHGTKIVQSVFKSLELIRNEKPDVCLSFGSYVAVPIALACKIAGVPVVTHEQVLGAGRASRFIGKFANAIAVSHEESIKYFPARKCVVTGLPLRPVLFQKHPQPEWLHNVPPDLPIVVVMGGSTGSIWMNELVGRLLDQLTEKVVVIHQTGLPSKHTQWLEKAIELKASLPAKKVDNYYPKATFSPQELSWLYQHAGIVVSRAGANTVAELLAFAVPSILIPLPTSAAGEQEQNAKHAAKMSSLIQLADQTTITDDECASVILRSLHLKRTSSDFHLSLEPQKRIMELIERVSK